MSNENTLESLLWNRLDGELSAEGRERLESLLTEHAAREEEQAVAELAALLGGTAEVDPPEELRGRVVEGIRRRSLASTAHQPWLTRATTAFRRALATMFFDPEEWRMKENVMKRKQLVVLAAIALALAGVGLYLALSDEFPASNEVTGAIGGVEAADRYSNQQWHTQLPGCTSSRQRSQAQQRAFERYDRRPVQ